MGAESTHENISMGPKKIPDAHSIALVPHVNELVALKFEEIHKNPRFGQNQVSAHISISTCAGLTYRPKMDVGVVKGVPRDFKMHFRNCVCQCPIHI